MCTGILRLCMADQDRERWEVAQEGVSTSHALAKCRQSSKYDVCRSNNAGWYLLESDLCSIQTQAPMSFSLRVTSRAMPPPPHTKMLALSGSMLAITRTDLCLSAIFRMTDVYVCTAKAYKQCKQATYTMLCNPLSMSCALELW